MDSWKALVIALAGTISTQAVAYQIDNPVERTLVITTLVPTFILSNKGD